MYLVLSNLLNSAKIASKLQENPKCHFINSHFYPLVLLVSATINLGLLSTNLSELS